METPPPPASPDHTSGASIASLTLGILSVVLSLLFIGLLPGIAGLGIGLTARRRGGSSRRMANWGAGLSTAGIILSISIGAWMFWVFGQFKNLELMGSSGPDLMSWQRVQAPDLTVTTLDGRELKLSDLRGKRVIVDFWATWCPPCVKEIPHFAQLYRETRRDQLEIVGISSEDTDTVRSFARKNNIPYPLGSAVELVAPYDVLRSIPTTFFIDRRGVIQTVLVGYHELEVLRKEALAEDTEGDPLSAPAKPESGLKVSTNPWPITALWTNTVAGARSLATGDLNGDGVAEVLVNAPAKLHRFTSDGRLQGTLNWPGNLQFVEVGRNRSGGSRLLGFANWGKDVQVFDRTGRALWSFPSKSGVNGAPWGDLDGDGTDEMVVGQNGGGGLNALSADGKLLWSDTRIGNVWNQAIVPALNGQSALVFATEAGGSVRVYQGDGTLIRILQLNGGYCAAMSAARMGTNGPVLAIGEVDRNTVAATDETGHIYWRTPVSGSAGNWRRTMFQSGDLNGDGELEWVFQEEGNLVVVSPDGRRHAALPVIGELADFAVAADLGGRVRLVILQGDLVTAFSVNSAGNHE